MKTRKKKNRKKYTYKSSRQTLEGDCLKLWGLFVRNRDENKCMWCQFDGKFDRYGNNPHHIVPRAIGKIIKWDIDNGVCLCKYCHAFRIKQEPIEYTRFMFWYLGDGKPDIGEVRYITLKKKSRQIWKPTIEDLEEIKEKLSKDES